MIKVPSQISSLFESVLEQHAIALAECASYRKWLRYYLDFCHKYRFNPAEEKSRGAFLEKLQEKRQTPPQQSQAHQAISLYYQIDSSVFHQESAQTIRPPHSPGGQGNPTPLSVQQGEGQDTSAQEPRVAYGNSPRTEPVVPKKQARGRPGSKKRVQIGGPS